MAVNFPQLINSAVKTAMFNEWQRLSDSTSPEFIMPSLFGAGIDTLITAGYTIIPPDQQASPHVPIHLTRVKGQYAQLMRQINGAKEGQLALSLQHAQAIAETMDLVCELLRTAPRRRKKP